MFTYTSSYRCRLRCSLSVFFFNDTATTEIYTLSLHDALPICPARQGWAPARPIRYDGRDMARGVKFGVFLRASAPLAGDRKSTRLNSSHANISYAVFCLKKKKNKIVAKRA